MKILSSDRGLAILMTLAIIALLLTAVSELNRHVRSNLVNAATTRDRTALTMMVESGMTIGTAILVKDKYETENDSVQEDWNRQDKITEILADFPFDRGEMTLKITDELGKIQVNALVDYPNALDADQAKLWKRFLGAMIISDENLIGDSPLMIINPVKDWLDSKDDDMTTGLSGAENAYYQDLDPPITCRNGPIPVLSEIQKIKGITPELLAVAGGIEGVSEYMTTFGNITGKGDKIRYDGKININTAPMPVIACLLPPVEAHFAEIIVDYRDARTEAGEYKNPLDGKWYQKCPGCMGSNIETGLITTKSDIFRITCTASLYDLKVTARSIVRREKNKETGEWECKTLNWRWE